jgi:hypothetical protein
MKRVTLYRQSPQALADVHDDFLDAQVQHAGQSRAHFGFS